ncbi:alpha/beta-hydrolase [Xylariaceae sp. FL1651]|nr:alpha/beta-hydrolase [Xylariaceae sp. FL1651]
MTSTASETVANGTCTLEDGRRIAYNITGAKKGHPVFHLHGWPGARTEGSLFDVQAAELGVSIIAIDRPGIGLSTPQPRRTVLDHALDIRQVAKHLGLEAYSVMGVSGGGPYALACAFSIPPEELKSVALVCGQGPIEISLRGSKLGNQVITRGFQYCPAFLRVLMQGTGLMLKLLNVHRMSNERILEHVQTLDRWGLLGGPEKDRKWMTDHDTMLAVITSVREHFRQGVDGCLEEGRLNTSNLGFEVKDIKRNVRLWYGREDTDVAAAVGEEIARQLGKNATLRLEDETHLSLVINHQRSILRDLVDAARTA